MTAPNVLLRDPAAGRPSFWGGVGGTGTGPWDKLPTRGLTLATGCVCVCVCVHEVILTNRQEEMARLPRAPPRVMSL